MKARGRWVLRAKSAGEGTCQQAWRACAHRRAALHTCQGTALPTTTPTTLKIPLGRRFRGCSLWSAGLSLPACLWWGSTSWQEHTVVKAAHLMGIVSKQKEETEETAGMWCLPVAPQGHAPADLTYEAPLLRVLPFPNSTSNPGDFERHSRSQLKQRHNSSPPQPWCRELEMVVWRVTTHSDSGDA